MVRNDVIEPLPVKMRLIQCGLAVIYFVDSFGNRDASTSFPAAQACVCLQACVAVAKLSKALAWLSCVRSRERPEF